MKRQRRVAPESGFSLVEVLVAVGLLATALATLGQTFGIAVAGNASARHGTFAAVLAQQKIEQLRTAAAGGLAPSPPGSLAGDVAGYVDFIDRFGATLGGGTAPPGTVYVRRWSIEPLAERANTIVLQVVVMRWGSHRTGPWTGPPGRRHDEARVVTVRTTSAP
jgi:prepilin-type N-terminal cleavage/methylation domain-containing protein